MPKSKFADMKYQQKFCEYSSLRIIYQFIESIPENIYVWIYMYIHDLIKANKVFNPFYWWLNVIELKVAKEWICQSRNSSEQTKRKRCQKLSEYDQVWRPHRSQTVTSAANDTLHQYSQTAMKVFGSHVKKSYSTMKNKKVPPVNISSPHTQMEIWTIGYKASFLQQSWIIYSCH